MMMRMITSAGRIRFARTFTHIETMVAMVILTVATLGALGYQYYAAKQSRVATAQISATLEQPVHKSLLFAL
jgi:Tfp pilus assembly protein PilV